MNNISLVLIVTALILFSSCGADKEEGESTMNSICECMDAEEQYKEAISKAEDDESKVYEVKKAFQKQKESCMSLAEEIRSEFESADGSKKEAIKKGLSDSCPDAIDALMLQ